MYDLSRKCANDEDKVTKFNRIHEKETRKTGQPTKVVLDVVSIHMVVPIDI